MPGKPDRRNAGPGSRQGIQVIARAAAVLRALENENEGLSLGQIAKRVDLPRSTVQRIVNALAEEQLLISATPNARVILGPAIVRMAANASFNFVSFVRPQLESLSQETGETVDLSIQSGTEMVFVDQIAVSHRLSAVSAIGETFPVFSSANGKAALSLLDDAEVSELLADGLFAETPNTIVRMQQLLDDLAAVRDRHYALDNEEHTEGICAVGSAFRDPVGRIFAVSVPVPTTRYVRKRDAIIESLLASRKQLLAALQA